LKEAEDALKGDDKETIEAKTQALAQAAHKLAEQMYKEEQAKQQPAGEAAGAADKAAEGEKKDEGNVVDAEYTEVKDKKSA
jgi:molecular chaperone DnaK